MLTRRTLLGAAGGPLLAQGTAGRNRRKPNLIVLLADDLGYGDVSCYGSPDVPTPNIDALARGGARFTDGYVSAAVCSPSRAALLSGQYQHRFGHEFNSGPPAREAEVGFGLPAGVKILPQYLKPAGYTSGAFGKWHLGVRDGFHPLDRGFDEFFGFLPGANDFVTQRTPGARSVGANDTTGEIHATRAQPILRGRRPVEEDRYLTDALADEAVDFIERQKSNPFFLYLAFNAVHTPLHATEKYLDRFASIGNVRHRYLAAMTAAMDDGVGAVVKKIHESGLEKDTLIVFLSDNGCPVITGAGTNHPLNGEKVTYYEGGIRVPFAMQWPGRIQPGSVYRHPVVSRDILPTFLAAAGIRERTAFDGTNLMPYLAGERAGSPHEALFWRCGSARAVRRGNWKLLEFGESYSKLYDLASDTGEKNDVSGQHPAVVRDLRARWQSWSARMNPAAWPPRYRELTVNGVKLNWEL
ncbi:MAG: sulfatase [Bryobacteraceae bacterium]